MLRSQLSIERKRNAELKQTLISHEHANIQLAFYEEEKGFFANTIVVVVISFVIREVKHATQVQYRQVGYIAR